MPKSRYITSLEPQRGKATGALGFMEQLTGHLKSVGVFRPVTAEDTDSDRLIALLTGLYHLPFPAEDLYSVSMEAALSLLAASKYDELYTRIIERYKALDSRCDFIPCVGTDYTG